VRGKSYPERTLAAYFRQMARQHHGAMPLHDRRFSWGKIGSHSPPQAPVFLEDIASFCELIFLPHELDCHALIPV
jgi:hypothetical protein